MFCTYRNIEVLFMSQERPIGMIARLNRYHELRE